MQNKLSREIKRHEEVTFRTKDHKDWKETEKQIFSEA